jgi:hypothetical protein
MEGWLGLQAAVLGVYLLFSQAFHIYPTVFITVIIFTVIAFNLVANLAGIMDHSLGL